MSKKILKILILLFLLKGIYSTIVRPLLIPILCLPDFPSGTFGSSLPFILFAFTHAIYTLGWRHALIFFGVSTVISWVFEQAGVASGNIFGDYHYTDILGVKLGYVPVLIPLLWFMMLYSSYILTNCIMGDYPIGSYGNLSRVVLLSVVSAVIMTAQDLIIDPIASNPNIGFWVWPKGGGYFGVPLTNFIGWTITSFLIYIVYRLFEWRVIPHPLGSITKTFITMPFITYGSLIVAGMLVGPSELKIIGPFVLGIPILIGLTNVWFGSDQNAHVINMGY